MSQTVSFFGLYLHTNSHLTCCFILFSVQIPSGKERSTERCEKKDCEQGCEDNCRQSTRFREAGSSMSWSHMILVRWPAKISYCTRDEGLWPFIKTWNCRSFFLENWVKYRSNDSLDPRPYSLVLFSYRGIIQYPTIFSWKTIFCNPISRHSMSLSRSPLRICFGKSYLSINRLHSAPYDVDVIGWIASEDLVQSMLHDLPWSLR